MSVGRRSPRLFLAFRFPWIRALMRSFVLSLCLALGAFAPLSSAADGTLSEAIESPTPVAGLEGAVVLGDLAPAEGAFLAEESPRVAVAGGAAARLVAEGYRALAEGRTAEALAAYRAATQAAPAVAEAYLGLGASLQALGRPTEAAKAYERALALRPGDGLARARLVAVLGDLAPGIALERLGRLAVAYPDDAEITGRIGLQLMRQGRPLAALGAFEQAAALAPGDPVRQVNLAVAADRAGQAARALAAYRKAVTLLRAGGETAGVDLAALSRRARWLEVRLEGVTP